MHKSDISTKKVVFFTYSLATGGAERRLIAIANQFVTCGAQVKIALLDAPKVVFQVDPRVEIVFLKQDEKNWELEGNTSTVNFIDCQKHHTLSLWERLRLHFLQRFNRKSHAIEDTRFFLRQRYANRIKYFLQKYPDWTVVSFMSFCNVSTMMALQKLTNQAFFVECTSPEIEFPVGHPMNALKKRYYPRAQGGIYQTEEARDFYIWLQNKKSVIPNPVSGNYPDRHEGTRRKTVVSFARIEKEKNFPLLLDAFSLLLHDYPEYKLSIYGEGSAKAQLIEYARTLGLSERVTFHPFDVALHDKIKDCAMFVSSSNREGISNSMLEAMAIGLPTICTDCPAGGARMMIQPRHNGLLVPMHDKQALYLAMKKLIEKPELADKLSRNSVKIKEDLAIDKIARQWWNTLWEDKA